MIFFLNRMHKQRQGKVAALAISCLCLWGCASQYRSPQPLLSAEKVLYRLLERRSAFQDMRGRAAITIVNQGKKQSFLANLVFDSLHRIRIEGLGFADTPYFFLVADSNRICFYVPDQQRVLAGKSSSENLFRLTGIQLEPDTLVNLFSGNLPSDVSGVSPAALTRASWDTKEQSIEFPSSDGQSWYRIWMDRGKNVMVRMEIYRLDKKVILAARFEDYQKTDGYDLPRRIECSFISSKIQLKVKYKQFALNSEITDSMFHLQYPPDTRFEDIDNF